MAGEPAGGLPPMTEEQRREALEKARAARAAAKEARQMLSRGEVDPIDVLQDPEGPFARLRVRSFLTAIPGVGTLIAYRLMDAVGISQNKKVGGLGCRQREALTTKLKTVAGR